MMTFSPRFWALVVSMGFGICVHAQIASSSCTVDQQISQNYAEGTWNSAFRYLQEYDSAYAATHVEIPQTLHDTIMACIAAVYNTNLPARDTVVEMLSITQFMPIDLRRFELRLDTSHAWTNQVMAGNLTNTGNFYIDSLSNLYGFTLEYAEYMPAWVQTHDAIVRIKTNRPVNTDFLSKVLLGQAGVLLANAVSPSGDGNQIVFEQNATYNSVTFRFGWEDCPAGCVYQRDWLFYVFPDCSVRYVASYGDAYTSTVQLEAIEALDIYPNPAQDQIHLKLQLQLASGLYQYRLLNAQGAACQIGKITLDTKDITKLPLQADLKEGIYYLQISNAQYHAEQKIIVLR